MSGVGLDAAGMPRQITEYIMQTRRTEGQRALFFLFVVILMILYCAVNTKGSFKFDEEVPHFMNYNMLAEAFLAGQLYLKQGIHPERAKALDPSDPRLPFPYIVDAIALNGHYYFLQQPLPALFHAVWIALTRVTLPTGAAVVFSATACLLLIGLILWRIRESFFSGTPSWIFWFTWLSFGLSSSQMYMVSRAVVYHETIAVGVMFVLLGTLLFIAAVTTTRNNLAFMTFSGICFGAALASKVNLGLYPVCLFLCWAYYAVAKRPHPPRLVSQGFAFMYPVACSAMLLMIYNFLRFGNVFDFGREHCIIPSPEFYEYCCLKGHFFRLDHLAQNLYSYFAALPSIVHGRNFVWAKYGTHFMTVGDVMTAREDLVPLPIMMPVLTLCLLVPVALRFIKADRKLSLIIAVCIASSVGMFAFFTLYVWAAGRFVYEFTPLLFVIVFCVLAVLWEKVRARKYLSVIVVAILGLLIVAQALMGLVSAFNGAIAPVA